MTPARAGVWALRVSAAFLVVAALFHVLLPGHAETLLERPTSVRVVGVALGCLGVASLFAPGVIARIAAGVLLLSGLRRAVAPERMIETMQWASRPVHGLLILVGAILLAVVAVWSGRIDERKKGGDDG